MTKDAAQRILIVDDEEKLSRFMSICLTRAGFETTTCSSATCAREHLESEDWSLVLTDLMMPNETGFDLLQWIQQHRPNLPVIVVTAHSTRSVQQQVAHTVAAELITKPFSLRQLYEAVDRVLNSP